VTTVAEFGDSHRKRAIAELGDCRRPATAFSATIAKFGVAVSGDYSGRLQSPVWTGLNQQQLYLWV